jgi:hypothetical protein
MFQRLFLIMFLPVIVILSGCKYKKGDMYTLSLPGDSLNYVILTRGIGRSISIKASNLKSRHDYRGNMCRIKYVSDSATLYNQRGIILFNSSMPDIEKDMLTKGFFGAFSSKQNVIYLLVSRKDFEKYFRKTKLLKKQ